MRIRAIAAASGLVFWAFSAGCFVYGEELLTGGAGGAGGSTTTTSSTTSMGGTTTTTPTGTPCTTPADCPVPDSPCKNAICAAGLCDTENLPANTPLTDPMPGDCHSPVCDSAGGTITVESSKDIPDDGEFCTLDTCDFGMPKHTPKLGYSCNENGGKHCNDLGKCVQCADNADCASGVCKSYTCAAPECIDGMQNGSETDIDCGGACAQCATGKKCGVNTDCKSGVCSPGKICQPSCTDGVKNQNETDIDCGGMCGPCADTLSCMVAADCKSGVCTAGKCAVPTCSDGKKNGDETSVDCGGATCPSCPLNHIVINEVDYDQPNTDAAEYVEIYNGTLSDVSLAGLKLILIDGVSNLPYGFVDLAPGGSLSPGQYLVVCDSAVTPAAGALKINFSGATNQLQNGLSSGTGSPDGLALIDDTNNKLIDAISYEGGITTADLSQWGLGTVSLVEGVSLGAAVKDEGAGALCRYPNGKDTDSSAADWVLCTTPTPGAANTQ